MTDELPGEAARKFVLLIGLHPRVVDFSLLPNLDERTLTAGLQTGLTEVIAAGFAAEWCLTDDTWASAEAQVSVISPGEEPGWTANVDVEGATKSNGFDAAVLDTPLQLPSSSWVNSAKE